MPDIKVSGTFKDYHELLNKRLKYLHEVLQNFKSKRIALINKDRSFFQYNNGRFSIYNFSFNKYTIEKNNDKIHSTLPITKKYAEILLCYRWLFVKGDVFIGEWHVFGAEVFLHYSQFFVKGDFIIGGVECT